MVLIDIQGIQIPLEWLAPALGVFGFLVYLVFHLWRSQEKLQKPQTFIWAYESSGLTQIVEPSFQDSVRIKFDYEKKEYDVKHKNPFTPVGTSERIFPWRIGADETDDPEVWAGKATANSPYSLVAEYTHWEHEAHAGLLSESYTLKKHWILLVALFFMALMLGAILDAKWLHLA